MKIDKQICAQHPVDLVFAHAVPTHESLQGGRLVGRKMVNVHRWMTGQSIHHYVHKPLERLLLVRSVECPAAFVTRLASGIRQHKAKQIFPPAQADEGISLQIKEYVAC